MSKTKLTFSSESDMFGTTIRLKNRDKSYDKVAVKSNIVISNPFKKSDPLLNDGYLFHSPDITEAGWDSTSKCLAEFEGPFSVEAVYDRKSEKVEALLRVSEQMDAASIAWGTSNIWEKWSKEKQEDAIQNAKEAKKPVKIFRDKDGNLKATVTMETLADLED